MTTFHIYHCASAPENRRWMAQWERKTNLFSFCHGRTEAHVAELARFLETLHGLTGEKLREMGATETMAKINAKHGAIETKAVRAKVEPAYDPLDDL